VVGTRTPFESRLMWYGSYLEGASSQIALKTERWALSMTGRVSALKPVTVWQPVGVVVVEAILAIRLALAAARRGSVARRLNQLSLELPPRFVVCGFTGLNREPSTRWTLGTGMFGGELLKLKLQ
jgi:hypothetical protein